MVYKFGQIFLPLSQFTRVTDGQTDRQTDRIVIARPRLHSMQRGKKHNARGVCRLRSSSSACIDVTSGQKTRAYTALSLRLPLTPANKFLDFVSTVSYPKWGSETHCEKDFMIFTKKGT